MFQRLSATAVGRFVSLALVVWFVNLSLAAPSRGCSAVLLWADQHPTLARSYDWHVGHALVMVNQPQVAKRALALDNPAEWTSRYGSVTINQYGRELPCEGINEQGLAIAILWLDESDYPEPDERPSVTNAQWVQYQLDTAQTVAEVLASDHRVRITPLGGARVHYFVADATGDAAVVEFLNGRLVAHHGDTLPHPLITNDRCRDSQQELTRYRGFGGQRPVPDDTASLSRYVRLASLVDRVPLPADAPHKAALQVIDQVQAPSTQWQVAYDLEQRQIYFRTEGQRQVRRIDLGECQFGAGHPVRLMEIDPPSAGDVTAQLRKYRPADNRRLVERSFAATDFTRRLPAVLKEQVIVYPDVWCQPAEVGAASP